MMKCPVRYALTLCRRVFVLLLASVVLFGLAVWWMAPNINRMRPEIEHYLTGEMQLRDLSLGRLSWSWAWNIAIRAEQCSFTNQDGSLAVRDTQLSVEVSPWQLLFGTVEPYRIHLAHGYLRLVPGRSSESAAALLPGRLVMDDMTIAWQADGYQGEWQRFGMDMDSGRRSLIAHMPGVQLKVRWDAARLPEQIGLEFSDTAWLPKSLQGYVRGQISGNLQVKRLGVKRWRIAARFDGEGAAWRWPAASFSLPYDTMQAELTLHAGSQLKPERIELASLQWQHGKDAIALNGQWYEGRLNVNATSPRVPMPLIWSWLQGFGDRSWRQWLGRMHQGQAEDIKAQLQLPWQQPGAGLPTAAELAAMQYQVRGHVDGADIAPGLDEALITEVQGEVELDQTHLLATIHHARLPHAIGTGEATIELPWASGLLTVKGEGLGDAGRMHRWLAPDDAAKLEWGESPAKVVFELEWQPEEAMPRSAKFKLSPVQPWHLAPNDVPLVVSGGSLGWQLDGGIRADALQVQGELTEGTLSFQAQQAGDASWLVTQLKVHSHGDFARTVGHFQLPIADPEGSYDLQFDYHGEWQSRLDLSKAGWSNLLGQAKTKGVAMQIQSQGGFDAKNGHLDIRRIHCQANDFVMDGSGEFGPFGLKVKLNRLQTPAFAGSVSVSAPFGSDPWEMDVDASRLDRKALPQADALSGKPWSLRARLGTFSWDDARMQDVSMSLASKADSVGVFKASAADIGAVEVKDISAVFALPGKGEIDLRHFGAAMGAQRVMLSAWLTPKREGGMRWRGFAEMEGDFGRTMSRAGMSDLFSGGRMRALFSGQGEVLRDQPWWQGLQGRLRLRVDDGQVLTGGTLSKFLSAISLADLPKLLFGQRKDLRKDGLFYKRLQVEATLHDQTFNIKKLAMRSPAMDMAGHGVMNLETSHIDLLMAVRPFQNLDAMLAKIPLVRDLIGGAAHSIMRKVYHMHGPVTNARVDETTPEEAGLASPGLVESLFRIPQLWFDQEKDSTR